MFDKCFPDSINRCRIHYIKSYFCRVFDLLFGKGKNIFEETFNSIQKNITKGNMALNVFRNSLEQFYLEAITDLLKVNDSIDFKKLELLNSFFVSSGDVSWSDVKTTK